MFRNRTSGAAPVQQAWKSIVARSLLLTGLLRGVDSTVRLYAGSGDTSDTGLTQGAFLKAITWIGEVGDTSLPSSCEASCYGELDLQMMHYDALPIPNTTWD